LQQNEHAATTLLAPLKKPSALPGMPDWQVSSAGPLDTLRDIRDPFAIGGKQTQGRHRQIDTLDARRRAAQ